ncbi:MAG: four helix bundle protein [Terriglobales bacterium]
MAQTYRDLRVWQKAVTMVTDIYKLTQSFPKQELYGLTSQIRRAAVSIPSNIAEGKGRTNRDFSRFLMHARGSLWELETQLQIALNLGYVSKEALDACLQQTAELGRMLNGMLKAFQSEQVAD